MFVHENEIFSLCLKVGRSRLREKRIFIIIAVSRRFRVSQVSHESAQMGAHCVTGGPSSVAATGCTDVDDDGDHVPQAWVDSTPTVDRRHVDTEVRPRVKVVQDFSRNVYAVLGSDGFN